MNKRISNSLAEINKKTINMIFSLFILSFFIILLIFCFNFSPLIFSHIVIITICVNLLGNFLYILDTSRGKFLTFKNTIQKKNIIKADEYYGNINFITNHLEQIFLRTPSVISTLILYFLLLHIVLLVNNSAPNYKENILSNDNDIKSLTIEHLPDNSNINTFFLRKYWQHNQLLPNLNHQIKNKNETKNNSNNSLNSLFANLIDKNIKDSEYIYNSRNNFEPIFDYSILGFIFSAFLGSQYNDENLNYVFKDKSLTDTVKIKYGKNSTNCFLESNKIDQYFYNNEFILEFKDKQIIFKSLYSPPMEKRYFLSQLSLIVATCKIHIQT